jgi:hypothetical protein
MINFLYGVLGMLAALALFVGGAAAGWRLRIKYTDKTAAAVRTELSEQEKRRQREDAQAFSHLANYSPELAYGIVKAADIFETDEG